MAVELNHVTEKELDHRVGDYVIKLDTAFAQELTVAQLLAQLQGMTIHHYGADDHRYHCHHDLFQPLPCAFDVALQPKS